MQKDKTLLLIIVGIRNIIMFYIWILNTFIKNVTIIKEQHSSNVSEFDDVGSSILYSQYYCYKLF